MTSREKVSCFFFIMKKSTSALNFSLLLSLQVMIGVLVLMLMQDYSLRIMYNW